VVDEDTFRTGFAFDGSSVKGFQKISESDMLLMPDPASVFRDPFFDDPALSVFCDIADPIRRAPYSRDPRGIAGRAERLARSLGVADQVFFGPEIEFFVFDDVRFDQATQHGYYFLNSAAAFWSAGGQEGVPNLGHSALQDLQRPAGGRSADGAAPSRGGSGRSVRDRVPLRHFASAGRRGD
jgi:glutamine synthetase